MEGLTTRIAGDRLNRLVVDTNAELVAPVDSEETVLYASPAHEQELGYSLADESRLVLVTAREVTDRVRAEREFVANAAHELLTPLAAMNAALEVLQAGAKEVPEDRDAFLGDLEREVDRLGRLAHALLVLARVQATGESLRLQPVELRPLLQEVADGVRAGTDVPIAILCDEHTVLAERDLLERALSNLVANAVTHTRAGSIVLSAAPAAGRVGIEVRDTGCGMPAATRARAFDRFYRACPRGDEGFGLGLAIVHEIMRVLDGAVEIESEPGSGTAVRLVLPAAVA
jgi:two-component system phosphate regulon sensor histidine kinase PhoR